MEMPWVLILGTACDGGEASAVSASTSQDGYAHGSDKSSGDVSRRKATEAWMNHTSLAFLQCDIALFPDDLSLSREEFLSSVWRLPSQRLHPCGTDNILNFPEMNITNYRVVLSSCHIQDTDTFGSPLALKAEVSADAKVSWYSITSDESAVAYVQAEIELSEARLLFFERYESKVLLMNEESFDLDVDCCLEHECKFDTNLTSEKTILLEIAKARFDSYSYMIDYLMIFVMINGTFLIICAVKLMFFENVSSRRKRRTDIDFHSPGGRVSQASYPKESLVFQTPRVPSTKDPWLIPSTVSTFGCVTVKKRNTEASPCETMATEWKQSHDKRRSKRAHDLGPRRLIPPSSPSNQGSQELTQEVNDRESEEGANDSERVLRVSSSGEESSITAEKSDPEKIARELWSFGF